MDPGALTLATHIERPKTSSRRMHALLVDDDDLFRESLGQNLVDAGFEVSSFDSGEAVLGYVQDGGMADVILLDWKMPGMNGIEVLRRLRQSGVEIPVIFLTVLSDQIYEEAALQGGAVDFVEKSRSFSILLKRIDLILDSWRGARGETVVEVTQDIIRDGSIELHLGRSRAFWKGKLVDLTLTEFNIVRYLVGRSDQDVRYRDLYDVVHGENFIAGQGEEGHRANVRAFIKRIRQKFRDVDDSFSQIDNYPGFGYRWICDGADAIA